MPRRPTPVRQPCSDAVFSPRGSESSSATSGSPRIRIEQPGTHDHGRHAALPRAGTGTSKAEIGPPADVFAATAVLWKLLTGDVPAANDSLDAQLATVPPAWREAFVRGLAPEPEERFATMPEWEAAALGALDEATGTVRVGFRAAHAGNHLPVQGPGLVPARGRRVLLRPRSAGRRTRRAAADRGARS